MIKTKNLTLPKTIWSMALLIVYWAILRNVPYNVTSLIFGNNLTDTQSALVGIFMRLLWILPVFWLIKHYEKDLKISLKEMFVTKINRKVFFCFFAFFTIYVITLMFVNHRKFNINPSFNPYFGILPFLMVGFVEEMAYRGWGMNACMKFMSEKKAMVVSTVFFLVLHYPKYIMHWITSGTLNLNGTNTIYGLSGFVPHSILIFLWGLMFSYMFKKNKSIVTCIALHTYYDYIHTLFIG